MTGQEITILVAGLAAMAAVGFVVFRWMLSIRSRRLMRCPETGAIALVDAEENTHGEATVRSCDLWRETKDCARGCLERYEQTAPGLQISIEALRPFERPEPRSASEGASRQKAPLSIPL